MLYLLAQIHRVVMCSNHAHLSGCIMQSLPQINTNTSGLPRCNRHKSQPPRPPPTAATLPIVTNIDTGEIIRRGRKRERAEMKSSEDRETPSHPSVYGQTEGLELYLNLKIRSRDPRLPSRKGVAKDLKIFFGFF